MAAQICPKCKQKSFTWKVDDAISTMTIWNCFFCNYTAFENEKLETFCEHCGNKTKSKLQDKYEEYWWCNICDIVS